MGVSYGPDACSCVGFWFWVGVSYGQDAVPLDRHLILGWVSVTGKMAGSTRLEFDFGVGVSYGQDGRLTRLGFDFGVGFSYGQDARSTRQEFDCGVGFSYGQDARSTRQEFDFGVDILPATQRSLTEVNPLRKVLLGQGCGKL